MTTTEFISAIFFREESDNIDFFFKFNQNTGIYSHLQVDLLPDDLDPSLNLALARSLYSQIYNFNVASQDDYIQLLNKEEHFFKFSDILNQINNCDTLIDGKYFKILFLNYNQFFQEKYPLHKIDFTSNNVCQQTELFFFEHNIIQYVNLNLHAKKTYFCILNSEDKKLWVNIYEGLFQGILQSENQKWITIDLFKMEPIDDDIFKRIKGFIVTGSHYDAYDTSIPWVLFSYDIFNRIIYPEEDNNQKLIAICWGHQAIGHGCGGMASRMPHKNVYQFRDQINFKDVDIDEKINLSKLLPQPFYSIKCHGDYVFELPREAKQISSSDKVEVEGMVIRNRAITFQFHPEFNKTILFKILEESDSDEEFILQQIEQAKQSFSKEQYISNKHLNTFLKDFLVS